MDVYLVQYCTVVVVSVSLLIIITSAWSVQRKIKSNVFINRKKNYFVCHYHYQVVCEKKKLLCNIGKVMRGEQGSRSLIQNCYSCMCQTCPGRLLSSRKSIISHINIIL